MSGRQGPRFARLGVDLATEPLVLDGQLHRCGHRLHQVRIVENRAGMHERGHGSAVALEERHRAALAIGGKVAGPPHPGYRPAESDQWRTERVGSREPPGGGARTQTECRPGRARSRAGPRWPRSSEP